MVLAISAEWAAAVGSMAAALATTAAVIVALFEILRTRRPRITVRCSPAVVGRPEGAEHVINVSVTNAGYRPTKITMISLVTERGWSVITPRPHELSGTLPALLSEGDSVEWVFNEERHLQVPRARGDYQRLIASMASDSAGRSYYGPGPEPVRGPLWWHVRAAHRRGRRRAAQAGSRRLRLRGRDRTQP